MKPRLRTFGALAALAATVAPSRAQTAQEISLAGHVLRRTGYGAGLGDYPAVLPAGTTSQLTQIQTYFADQILQTNITESTEHANLLGAAATLYPAPLTDVARGWASTPSTVPQPGTWTIEQLSETNMVRALWSNFTLREKMTQFWQRHFSTNYFALVNYFVQSQSLPFAQAIQYAAYFEAKQNDLFRTHCMGTFKDLLLASAQGEAMMIYLDTVNSGFPTANQNYARELLELHTLGLTSFVPSGGNFVEVPNYSFQDILDIADIFSGWSLAGTGTPVQFAFTFKPTGTGNGSHIATSGSTYSLFDTPGTSPFVYIDPVTFTFGPMPIVHDLSLPSEGLTLIQNLADSPVTAEFITRKLYRYFVSPVDLPPFDPLILDCITAWRSLPGGNLPLVLWTLLTSNEMLNAQQNRWTLARTPLEVMGQFVAVLDGKVFDPNDAPGTLSRIARLRVEYLEEYLGQNLFRYGPPEGFQIDSTDLLTTERLLGRTKLAQELYGNFGAVGQPFLTGSFGVDYINTMAPFVNLGDEAAITNWWDLLWSSGDQPQSDWSEVFTFYGTATTGTPPPFQPLLTTLGTFGLQAYIDQFTQASAFAAASTLNTLK